MNQVMGWGVVPSPNGSTELTLDNEGLQRKGGPTRKDLGSDQQGTPKKNGVQGVFGLGTWEEGVWGRTALLEEPQQDSAYFLRTKQSIELALGRGRGRGGAGPSAWPEMGTGEGASLELASLVPTPNLASPLQGQGREEVTPH